MAAEERAIFSLVMKKTKDNAIIVTVVMVFLIVCAACLNNIVIYTPDSARYLVWAKSLANFRGFYDDTTADPSKYVLHGPMYPLLLAPAAFLFPLNAIAAKVVTILSGSLVLVLFCHWLKSKVSSVLLTFTSFALAINSLTVLYSTQVLSDVPFLACVVALLLALEKSVQRWSFGLAFAILASITIGCLLREVGLVLMMTTATWFAMHKEYQRALVFFAVPSLFIVLWALRNELVVGPLDSPAATNAQVFFMHIFTPHHASLFEELKERAWSNLLVYKDLFGMLAFLPGYVPHWYAVSTVEAPWVQFAFSFVGITRIPIILLTLTLAGVGFFSEWKKSATPRITSMFIGFYALPILFYPVNDVRFVLPLVPVVLYHFAVGIYKTIEMTRQKLRPRTVDIVQWVIMIVCILPGVVWVADFVANNIAYGRIHSKMVIGQELNELPPHFRRPVDLAGKFIAGHTDSCAVVGTVWKDLALWLEGRKIVELNPQISVDQFDIMLRDYDVRYLMITENALGVKEFEMQMALSRRFQFQRIVRLGEIHILKVKNKQEYRAEFSTAAPSEKKGRTEEEDGAGMQFQAALAVLETDPVKAESLFVEMWASKKGLAVIVFHIAIAKEFSNNLETANAMFKGFTRLRQAGWYLTNSLAHQEIIATLQEAITERDGLRRAEKFQRVAVSYWELGFRKRAMEMLRRSLAADPAFFPSLIFGSLYSLQRGDTIASRKYHKEGALIEPANELVQELSALFQQMDTLNLMSSIEGKEKARVGIAKIYIRIGMRENAIDELLYVLARNPYERHALELLADVYVAKRRFAPARKTLSRLLALDPSDKNVAKKLNMVLQKWL